MSGPEKIESILHNSARIKLLTEIARVNSELKGLILDAIPADLKEDIVFSHLKNGRITLIASGPVVATKARFIAPEILKKIQGKIEEHPIKSIELKVSYKI